MKPSQSLKTKIQAGSRPTAYWSQAVFKKQMQFVQQETITRGLGRFSWLALVTATTMTIGSPESIGVVAQQIVEAIPPDQVTEAAEFSREIGMMCLAMVGVCTLNHRAVRIANTIDRLRR